MLFCPIRREWVADLPEERVRQGVITLMTQTLGYPASLIAVEKGLEFIPHLHGKPIKVPKRRADIICFGKNIHPNYPIYPLLLIECKAVPLNDKVIRQVVGYNHFLQAYYIATANAEKIRTGWYDPGREEYAFIDGLPYYDDLKIPRKHI